MADLTSWFPLDFLTSMPLDLILVLGNSGGDESDNDLGDVFFLRMVRVFRVAKLARLLRASRIYSRWIDYVGVSFAIASLVRFLVMTCILAHWLACFWGYTGQRANEASEATWHSRLPESFTLISYGPAQYAHALDFYGVCICTHTLLRQGSNCFRSPTGVAIAPLLCLLELILLVCRLLVSEPPLLHRCLIDQHFWWRLRNLPCSCARVLCPGGYDAVRFVRVGVCDRFLLRHTGHPQPRIA